MERESVKFSQKVGGFFFNTDTWHYVCRSPLHTSKLKISPNLSKPNNDAARGRSNNTNNENEAA